MLDFSPNGRRIVVGDGEEIFVVDPKRRALNLLTRRLREGMARWSPDRSQIAFVRAQGPEGRERAAVWAVDAEGKREEQLGVGHSPVWSPDGSKLAYVRSPELRAVAGPIVVTSADGSNGKVVGVGSAPTWAPDGQQLAYVRYQLGRRGNVARSTLILVRSDGSKERVVLSTRPSRGEPIHRSPLWSPDGTAIVTIAAYSADEDLENSWISLLDPATRRIRKLGDLESVRCFLSWSRDGSRLAYAAGRAVGVIQHNGSRRVLYRAGASYASLPAWSPDGRSIGFVACNLFSDCDVFVVEASGSPARRITNTPGFVSSLDWQ